MKCTCELEPASEMVEQLGDGLRFKVRLVKCPLCNAAPELMNAARAAWHLCASLLASPGATPELIGEVQAGLADAIQKAKGRS